MQKTCGSEHMRAICAHYEVAGEEARRRSRGWMQKTWGSEHMRAICAQYEVAGEEATRRRSRGWMQGLGFALVDLFHGTFGFGH